MAQLLLARSYLSIADTNLVKTGLALKTFTVSSRTAIRNTRLKNQSRIYNSVCNASPRTSGQFPRCVVCLRAFATRSPLLSLLSPLGYLRQRREAEVSHEVQALAQIPREVFKKDVLVKQQAARNFFMRIFHAVFKKISLYLRFLRLTLTFGPLVVVYPLTLASHRFQRLWWHWLLRACESSGPTFIKLGQWAGTRRDLFSDEFCDLFSPLHTKVKPHSWYITRKKLTKAFGKNWTKIFVAVDRKCIGSGCIAQVHKGYMRSDMVPNESVLEEVLDDDDATAENIDFSEGLEIIGFGHVIDSTIDTADSDYPDLEFEKSRRWWRQEGTGSADQADTSDGTSSGSSPSNDQSSHSDANEEEIQLIPVAIKVLHPSVFRTTKRNLYILETVASLAEFFFPSLRWLSLKECVKEFSDLMTKQVDLRYECRSLEKFNENFSDNPNIRFPRPIRPYCKRDVLVETFEEGELISNFIKEEEDEDMPSGLRETLASYGLDALLQMVFVDNFVHGDLHPGNILVQNRQSFVPADENKLMLLDVCDTVVVNVRPVENPVRLVMLDVGIATSLSTQDMQNFKDVFSSVVIGEGHRVAELMLHHSTYHECKDVDAFTRELGTIVMEARRETIKLGKIDAGSLLTKVFRVLNRHKVKMESNFASIILAIFVLEGLGRSLDPEIDLLERAKPVLLS